MVTVLRERGFHVVIYTSDHPPAHVHVFGDAESKIALNGPKELPEVLTQSRSGQRETRRALELVTENRLYLLQRWSDLHD